MTAKTTSEPRSVGATIRFIILPVAIGIPLVGYLWETVNQLLAGIASGTRLAISFPLLIGFVLLLRWLARALTTPPGSTAPSATELAPDEQPVVRGTLFLMLVFLMMIAGFWAITYAMLMDR